VNPVRARLIEQVRGVQRIREIDRECKDRESLNLAHITRCICGAWGWLPRGACDLCGCALVAYVPERLAG